MSGRVLIYGITGFSGRLLAKRLRQDGHYVVAAGRDASRVRAQADALGLPCRVIELNNRHELEYGLADISVVVHAAGPFQETAAPMIEACVHTGTHYLDLAGEWPVFVLAQRRGPEAAAARIMLMPGVGFSIVASDSLLAYAARSVSNPSLLRLAISTPEVMSRGTFRSMVQLTSAEVVIRQNGALRRLPVGRLERPFDFGQGERLAVAVTWPDVVTGQRTTGVANIETYAEASQIGRLLHRAGGLAAHILGDGMVQRSLAVMAAVWPTTPLVSERQRAGHAVVVEAVDRWRRSERFRLRTRDGYTVTAATASAVVRRVLNGDWAPGFQTPASLYGPELLLELGCAWLERPEFAATHLI